MSISFHCGKKFSRGPRVIDVSDGSGRSVLLLECPFCGDVVECSVFEATEWHTLHRDAAPKLEGKGAMSDQTET